MAICNVFIGSDAIGVNRPVLDALYDAVIPQLSERIGGEYADIAEAKHWSKYISFSDLNTDDFNYAYDLVLKACDENELLAYIKSTLDNKFKADGRYREHVV